TVPALPPNRRENRQLVASAGGLAADWVELRDANSARPIVLKLARATVPVRGRVLTLEGKPVRGAIVRVRHVPAPAGTNGMKQMVEEWLSNGKRLWYPPAGGLPEKVKTDAEGKFVLTGVGDARVVSLELSADTIETVVAWVAVDPAFDPRAVRLNPSPAMPG